MVDEADRFRNGLSARYHLGPEIGRGGMATVFRAVDVKSGASVAVKVLRFELARAIGPQRFLREIEIVARLDHPNVVPMLDSGEVDGHPFYVMPVVEGESLAARIGREGALPIEATVGIGAQVAKALAYAHSQGIIHRDVKPANILLDGERAVVADFGLARAVERSVDGSPLTSSGLALGTPTYMSPEQAAGTSNLTERTDVYAFGCVLYHMLVGDPPFVASSAQGVLARHATAQPVPPRQLRPTVPEWLDTLVLQAMAKVPSDRPQSAAHLVAALSTQHPAAIPWLSRTWLRSASVVGIGAVGVAAAIAITWPRGPAVVPLRLAVLPVEVSGDPTNLPVRSVIMNTVARWTDATTVDTARIDRVNWSDPGNSATDAAARRLGVGFVIRSRAVRVGDSVLIALTAFKTGDPAFKTQAAGMAPRTLGGSGELVVRLTEAVLAGRSTAPSEPLRTTSLAALQAFGEGANRLDEWDLVAADSAFSRSTRLNPRLGSGWLALAVARYWQELDIEQWRHAAARAAALEGTLARGERLTSAGLAQLVRGERASACSAFDAAAADDPTDGLRWYTLATCLRQDALVVRDVRSRTGWRFRTSYAQVIRAYVRAFELRPTMHRGFGHGSFQRVRDILFTNSARSRGGRTSEHGPTVMAAMPEWEADSLVFFPEPISRISSAEAVVPPTNAEAIARQRQLFRRLAEGWTSTDPGSATANEALATAFDLLYDPAALTAARRARAAARTPTDSVRTAALEFWLSLKAALPNDSAGIRRAGVLADSLLRHGSTDAEASVLAPIAAVTGRIAEAVQFYRVTMPRTPVVGELGAAGPAVLLYTGVGGPPDSVAHYAALVNRIIEGAVAPEHRPSAARDWLARPGAYWFPKSLPREFAEVQDGLDPLFDAQRSLLRGDTATAVEYLNRRDRQRNRLRPEEQSLDAVVPDTRLVLALGKEDQARKWLGSSLAAIRWVPFQELASLTNSVSLLAAMRLRSELSFGTSDEQAALWRRAAEILAGRPH
ncbi:MAG: serine/threonine-protein kinase [Gemmatimonadales bacterium]